MKNTSLKNKKRQLKDDKNANSINRFSCAVNPSSWIIVIAFILLIACVIIWLSL